MRDFQPAKTHTVIWLFGLGLLFTTLALFSNFSLPLGESSDEPYYLDYALFLNTTGRVPLDEMERETAGPRGGYPPVYYALLASAIKFADLNDFSAHYLDLMKHRLQNDLHWHPTYELWPYRGIFSAWHLGRVVSLLTGLGVIATTYLWGKTLFQQKTVALALAAFVAFLPRFIINSAVLSDDNLTAFFAILFLLLLIKIIQTPTQSKLYFGAGIVLALGTLSKYHAFVLILSVVFLFGLLLLKNSLSWRKLLSNFIILGGGFLLIAGPWLGWVFYQFNRIPELGFRSGLMITLGLPAYAGDRVVNRIPFGEWILLLFKSFWLEYGWMTLYGDAIWYTLFGLLLGLSLLGWLRFWPKEKALWSEGILLTLFQSSLFFLVVLVRYVMGGGLDTPQGRHLFPALPGIALLVVIGWQHLGKHQTWRWLSLRNITLAYTGVSILSLLAFTWLTVKPAFPYRPVAKTNFVWQDTLALDGYQTTPVVIQPGEAAILDLYWQKIRNDYQPATLFLQIINRDGAAISQLDEPLPSDLFPGKAQSITPQQYALWTGQDIAPGAYLIRMGLYNPNSGERYPIFNSDDELLGDQTHLGLFYVTDGNTNPRTPQRAVHAQLGDGIELLGYSLTATEPSSLKLKLHWRAAAPPTQNYTVFTQLLNSQNQVVGGKDTQPMNGFYPASVWQMGEIIVDELALTLPTPLPNDTYRLVTGMYLPETGERLAAKDELENPLPDNMITLLSAATQELVTTE